MKFKKKIPYDVTIHGTPNGGFIVKVGCAQFASSSVAEVVEGIREYMDNPDECMAEYQKAVSPMISVDVAAGPQIESRPFAQPGRQTLNHY